MWKIFTSTTMVRVAAAEQTESLMAIMAWMSDHILSILPIYKWSPSTVKHTESAFGFLFEARVRVTHVIRRRRHTFASSQKSSTLAFRGAIYRVAWVHSESGTDQSACFSGKHRFWVWDDSESSITRRKTLFPFAASCSSSSKKWTL